MENKEVLLEIIQISTAFLVEWLTLTTALCKDWSVWNKLGDRDYWECINDTKSISDKREPF